MDALWVFIVLGFQQASIVFGTGLSIGSMLNDVGYKIIDDENSISFLSATLWSYLASDTLGPQNWSIVPPNCGALYQSPINIVQNRTLFVKRKNQLDLQGLRNVPRSILVENEGNSVKFTPRWNLMDRPMLRGGPLKTAYVFEQLHFHWGPTNAEGSEHMLDGSRFPLEVHLVFYNGLYGSFDQAKDEVDGLAVIGFFYVIAPNSSSSPPLNIWTQYIPLVRQPLAKFELLSGKSFSLQSVIGDLDCSYYSYEGSLTTPPCIETVTWMMQTRRLVITEREMNLLRSLLGFNRTPILINYRPVQPVNNRRVFLY